MSLEAQGIFDLAAETKGSMKIHAAGRSYPAKSKHIEVHVDHDIEYLYIVHRQMTLVHIQLRSSDST